ncbi:MAG: hypothetical protein HY914_21685 [Desulfomonile tiedjei]|nr:hypothetical protein [Desulfomonile tiedjei]
MSDIVTQLFGLTGKLIGFLLSWPFLLFVFLFWVVNRYRDQIGSMLDRRGAVKAAVISQAVQRGLEPIGKQLEAVVPNISALKREVDQLRTEQSKDKLTPALDAVQKKIAALEGRLTAMLAESERVLRNELSQGLTKERETSAQESTKLSEDFTAQQRQLATLAPQAGVDALAASLEPTRTELAAVTDAIALLRTQVDAAASKREIERLERDSASIKSALDAVTDLVREVETKAKSAPKQLERIMADAQEPVRRGMESLASEVDALRIQLASAAEAATSDRLQQELAGLKDSVDSLQQGLESVKGEIERRAAGPAETVPREVTAGKETAVARQRQSKAPDKPQATKPKRTPKRAG